VFVICYYKKNPLTMRGKKNTEYKKNKNEKDALFLLKEAEEFYGKSNIREAFAACYKSALAALNEQNIALNDSATEKECANIITKKRADIAEPFNNLVHYRIQSAYCALSPKAEAWTNVYDFCKKLCGEKQTRKIK